MDTNSTCIVALDRMHDGLFIYFSDGTSGFYPESLLHRMVQDSTPIASLLEQKALLGEME